MQPYPIAQHVLKYPVRIRILLLATFLIHRQELEQSVKQYPVYIELEGYKAVADSFSDFNIEGWTTALWNSL